MRSRRVGAVAYSVAALLAPVLCGAVTHSDKRIGQVFGPDNRDCFFLALQGVGQADPNLPNLQWFAVPRTHLGFRELFVLVTSQRLAGQSDNVLTTGQLACGHAEVLAIWTVD